MGKLNQVERILQIVSWLAMGETLSANIVAKRFENKVSKRDISRDFWHIFQANMPITYDERGREKFWYFDSKGYQNKIAQIFQNRNAE